MWPFSSVADFLENSSDPSESISPSLQSFFEEQDRSARSTELEKLDASFVHSILPIVTSVSEVEFHKFKKDPVHVAYINCSELQTAVLDCYKNHDYLKGTKCSEAMSRATKCINIQQDTLKRLRYEDCRTREQCMQIRVLADNLFTRNYGLKGENINPETEKVFESDLRRTKEFLVNLD